MNNMTNNLVYSPPEYLNIIQNDKDFVFLAGAIQGAENWQSQAIEYINDLNISINIANPRKKYLDKTFDYNKQVEWETHFLNKSKYILFWLPKEKEHICERAYAQTSRFELGEWLSKSKYFTRTLIIIGIEKGFSGERYIQKRLFDDYNDVYLYDSLFNCINCLKAQVCIK